MENQATEQPLSWLQERAVEDAFDARKKTLWLAYLLAVPLGCLGVHRFYLGRTRTGALMLGIWLTGFLITVVVVLRMPSFAAAMLWDTAAGLLMLSMWCWELVDLALIPSMVRKTNARIEAEIREGLHVQPSVQTPVQ